MPLIECPDCHEQISDAAPACPKCGRPSTVIPNAQIPEKKAKFETKKAVQWGCSISLAFVVLIFAIAMCSAGEKGKEMGNNSGSQPSTQSNQEASPKQNSSFPDMPKLNVGLKFFIDKMNAGLKKTGSPKIVADKENPKDDSSCTTWCVSNYSIGRDAAFVVWHKKDRINEIMSIVSGDGTTDGAIHSIYYQWLLVNTLSPGFEREQVTSKLMNMFEDIASGKDDSDMTLGGVEYKMHKLQGIGIVLTATK